MRKSIPLVSSVKQPSLLAYCLEHETLRFSFKMALVIGTILAVINHGYALFTGHLTSVELWSIVLTYCVPFAVAMYSQVQGKRQRDRISEVQSEIGASRKQDEPEVP